MDVRQEEVYAVKDFTAALPDAVEAQPTDCHYCCITAGCCAWILLIAHLQQSVTHSVMNSFIITFHSPLIYSSSTCLPLGSDRYCPARHDEQRVSRKRDCAQARMLLLSIHQFSSCCPWSSKCKRTCRETRVQWISAWSGP